MKDLMQKRFKVIAPYPCSPYKVGNLVELSDSGKNFLAIISGGNELWLPTTEIENMKEIFKELAWHEEREESEMPEYIKHGNNGKPRKVKEYSLSNDKVIFEGGRQRSISKGWLPSALEEYEAYINTQSK